MVCVVDPLVRDRSAEAIGTAWKLVGENAITPFLADVDNIKITKVRILLTLLETNVRFQNSNLNPRLTHLNRRGTNSLEILTNDKFKYALFPFLVSTRMNPNFRLKKLPKKR